MYFYLGIQISEEEAIRLNQIISPLVAKGQSPHAIYIKRPRHIYEQLTNTG